MRNACRWDWLLLVSTCIKKVSALYQPVDSVYIKSYQLSEDATDIVQLYCMCCMFGTLSS